MTFDVPSIDKNLEKIVYLTTIDSLLIECLSGRKPRTVIGAASVRLFLYEISKLSSTCGGVSQEKSVDVLIET